MKKISAIIIFLFFAVPAFAQFGNETITITTYYPSPYGVYRNLELFPSDEPTGPSVKKGLMFFNQTSDQIMVHNGFEFVAIGSGESGGNILNMTCTDRSVEIPVNPANRTCDWTCAKYGEVCLESTHDDGCKKQVWFTTAGVNECRCCSISNTTGGGGGGGTEGGFWLMNVTNQAIYNNNTGSVGIGTSAPEYKLHVDGSFAARYKNFQIPHPLDSKNKVLIHSSLEGPEHAVYYRGVSQLKNRKAEIVLPEYFEALTLEKGRTVQLTPVDGYSPLYVFGGIKNGRFVVKTNWLGNPSQRFFWEVKAVRKDISELTVEKKK